MVRYTCDCFSRSSAFEVMFRGGAASVLQCARVEDGSSDMYVLLRHCGTPEFMIDNLKLAISWSRMERECQARNAPVPPLELRCAMCPQAVEHPIQQLGGDFRLLSVVCSEHQGFDTAGISDRNGELWIHSGIALFQDERDRQTYADLRAQWRALEDLVGGRLPGVADRIIDTIKTIVAWGKAEDLVRA